MIPSDIHQLDLSLKHQQVIGLGGSFQIVPAHVVGSNELLLLIPVDEDTFEVVSNRIDLGGRERNPDGSWRPYPTWTTLTFDDSGDTVTADRGTVHDYDGDGVWTWHDDVFECVECAAAVPA